MRTVAAGAFSSRSVDNQHVAFMHIFSVAQQKTKERGQPLARRWSWNLPPVRNPNVGKVNRLPRHRLPAPAWQSHPNRSQRSFPIAGANRVVP